ncbi:MAG TPA: CAP domain-containing protein [archaeon]|nr:CAP domain-containing protein [archaeon]
MPNGIDNETELITELINGFRIANKKEPLILDPDLTLLSKKHAISMFSRFEELEHGVLSPLSDPQKRNGWSEEMAGYGVSNNAQEFAKELVLNWLEEDPRKRKAILKAKSIMGIGLVISGKRIFLTIRVN